MTTLSRPRRAARLLTAVAVAATCLISSAGVSDADPTPSSVSAAGEPQVSAGTAAVAADPTDKVTLPKRTYDRSALPRSHRSLASVEQWYESGTQQGTTMNCLFGYPEQLGMSWTGWFGEIGKTPTTSQPVYYTKIGWGVSGNTCGGGAYVHIEEFLPPGSQLAISKDNPVMCWYDGLNDNQLKRFTNDCPQQPQTGQQGGLAFDPAAGAWPTATTTMLEIWIPIRSTQPLNGIIGNPCNSCLQAGVWMIDGVSSPWAYPRIGVMVVGNAPTNPTVSYPAPSIRNTSCCNAGPGSNQAQGDLVGWIFTTGKPGATEFQIGESPGSYNALTVPGQITQTDINTYGPDIEQWVTLWFDPDRTYYWRMCFTPTGGTRRCGPQQSFNVPSPPDNSPPQTTIQSKPPAQSGSRTAQFTFSSSKPNSIFRCQLDGGAWEGCLSPATFTDLADGTHTLQVKATSSTGVEDSTPASYTWTVNPLPKVQITSGPAKTTKKTKATFSFTANEEVQKFQCKLDAAKWRSCTSPTTYTKLSRKKHTFSVRATDLLGAVSKPVSKTWTVKR